MSRLVTFGCSYTYGKGLEDCQDWPLLHKSMHSYKPSQLGWPNQLSDKLGVGLVNKSYPGSSNLEILYEILQFDFKQDDIVVIMWSHYLRDMLFTRFFKWIFLRRRLGAWKNTGVAKKWVEQMSERDYSMRTWIYLQHASLYLNSKGIKYIHYPAAPHELREYEFPRIHVDNLHMDGIEWIDNALDGSHPGPATHAKLTDKIFNILNESK